VAKPRVEIQNLTRSCNEALILSSLESGPRHGYQLVLDIEARSGGAFRFKHGTLYPILHKLEKDGHIRGVWSEEGPRGKRKSYALTAKGRRYAEQLRASWDEFLASFAAATGREAP